MGGVMRGEELEGQDAEGTPAHAQQAGTIRRGVRHRADGEDDRERVEGLRIRGHRRQVSGVDERATAGQGQRSATHQRRADTGVQPRKGHKQDGRLLQGTPAQEGRGGEADARGD